MDAPSPAQGPALDSFWLGMRTTLPLCVSAGAFGIVWGVLAGQAGLNLLDVVLMSALVFAGASQFVAAELWNPTGVLPVGTIVAAVLIINLRLMLMSATLRPLFAGWPTWRAVLATHLVTDESWAMTIGEMGKGRGTAAFFVGSGIAMMTTWLVATLTGRILGGGIEDPAQYGLDFVFTASFLALLLGSWKSRLDLVPWIAGGLVAVIVARFVPGQWHILAGGLVGSLAGAAAETLRARRAA